MNYITDFKMSEVPTPDELAEKMMQGNKFEQKLIEQRKVFLWGAVTDESAKKVVDRILYLEAIDPGKEINFYINSPGGVVTSGMVVYDAIKLITSPVNTICMGLAASMGSILLSVGTKGKRQIWPNGRVMIHQPSIGGAYGQATDLEITANEIQKTKEMGGRILSENCGQPYDRVMKDLERDFWMSAEEAVQYGIVDSISTTF
jgi:ATP-dependent Clp protease protease subunit